MFLALKEIKHEKMRYGLIIAMIVLISYLIFILTSLALGLARENTAAIEGWGIKSAILNKDADVSLRQSLLTTNQVKKLTKNKNNAVIAETSVVATSKGKEKQSATFIGIDKNQFISKDLQLTNGHKPQNNHQVVVDDSFKQSGYKLNDKLAFNSDNNVYTIVGFTHDAKLNITPIIYGTIPTWQNLRGIGTTFSGSAIVSKKFNIINKDNNLKTYSVTQVINKLPGYTAQNSTFIFMIGFLMIISLIIIAVFLYIITIQKLGNYAVLRAQGSPAKLLVNATFSQSLLLTLIGLGIGIILTIVTALVIPSAVPIAFSINFMALVSIGLVIMALLGSIIPIRIVLKVDPVSVIGG